MNFAFNSDTSNFSGISIKSIENNKIQINLPIKLNFVENWLSEYNPIKIDDLTYIIDFVSFGDLYYKYYYFCE